MNTFETEKHNIPEGATHYANETKGDEFAWYKMDDGVSYLFCPNYGRAWEKCQDQREIYNSDVKPIPTDTKYRYEKVEFEKASEAVKAWEDGELFTNVSHETYAKTETAKDALTYLYRLYRRIEVTERELLVKELHEVANDGGGFISLGELINKIVDSGKFKLVNGKG